MTFDTNQVEEGTAITHTASSGDFSLTEDGTYLIAYSTTATNSTGTGTAAVELEQDSTPIPGSKASATIAATSNLANLAATVLVNVASAPSTIQLTMEGSDLSFTDTAIVIHKLD